MKKSAVILSLFIFSIIILSLFSITIINAELVNIDLENPDQTKVLGINPTNAPTTPEELKNQSSDYLKQEWGKILEKSSLGRGLLIFSNALKFLSPVFKFFTGVPYSLSWAFFLSVGIWILVFIVLYSPTKDIIQANNWVAVAIAAIIPTLAAQFGTIEKIVNALTPLLTNKWIVLVTIIVTILLLIVYHTLMKKFGESLEEQDKKEKEKLREIKAKTVEKLHDIKIKSS